MFSSIAQIDNILRSKPLIKTSNLLLPAHFILGLFFLFKHSHGGRYILAKELCISDSRSRILLELYNKNKFLEPKIGRQGSFLTNAGLKLATDLFESIIILNPEKSWDLGNLTLGEVNAVVAFPLKLMAGLELDVINVRDIALRCGALGATVLKISMISTPTSKSFFKIEFYEKNHIKINSESNISTIFSNSFKALSEKVYPLLFRSNDINQWIAIAATNNENQRKTADIRYIDVKNWNSFNIARLAAIQGVWECLYAVNSVRTDT
jgi:hypothetical protein